MLKKMIVLIVTLIFMVSGVPAYAGPASGCVQKDTKGSSGPKSMFQKASENVGTWNATNPRVHASSLRQNREELRRRRRGVCTRGNQYQPK